MIESRPWVVLFLILALAIVIAVSITLGVVFGPTRDGPCTDYGDVAVECYVCKAS